MRHDTYICGIPCIVDSAVHGKYKPAKIFADPDDCYEAQYPEIEFTVLDRKGYPAPWLTRKLTKDDTYRIETEILQEYEDAASDF